MMIYFITGGQRSGKSSYGQKIALKLSQNPIYLATSRIWDEDHKLRIKRHKSDRDDSWTTIEEEKYISNNDFTGRTVLMDCVTLWLTNFFTDNKNNVDRSLKEAKDELTKLFRQEANFILISNEIGMGLHADTEVERITDLQGWMNQFISGKANEVYLMVSGIPVKVK